VVVVALPEAALRCLRQVVCVVRRARAHALCRLPGASLLVWHVSPPARCKLKLE